MTYTKRHQWENTTLKFPSEAKGSSDVIDENEDCQPDGESESSPRMQLLVQKIEDQVSGFFWPENHE